MNSFWTALGFLTILPTPKSVSIKQGEFGNSATWFPFVGLLIGTLVALAYFGFHFVLPSLLSSALCVALWVWLTGGLHLDGLADCCDGLLNASTPERRLEIMKDPHVGTLIITAYT